MEAYSLTFKVRYCFFDLGHISNLFIGRMRSILCIITGTNLRDKSEQQNMLLFIKLSFDLAQCQKQGVPKDDRTSTVVMISRLSTIASRRGDCMRIFSVLQIFVTNKRSLYIFVGGSGG